MRVPNQRQDRRYMQLGLTRYHRVAVYYYRSQHYNLGDALCWVDDNEKGAVPLAGYWTKQYNVAV